MQQREARGQHSIMGLACCALLIGSSFPYLLDKPFLLIIASPQILRHSRHLNRHSQDILSKMRKDSWDWQSELRIIGTTDFRQIKFDEPIFNYNYLVPTKQCSGLYHLTAHKGSFEEIPPVRIWKLNWEPEELNRGGSCVLG